MNQTSIFLLRLSQLNTWLQFPPSCVAWPCIRPKHAKQPNMVIIMDAGCFVLTNVNFTFSYAAEKFVLSGHNQQYWTGLSLPGLVEQHEQHSSRYALSKWIPILCPYLVWLTLPILPLEFTVALQTSRLKRNTDTCWWEYSMATVEWTLKWHNSCLKHFIGYKKYFCDQINILHTASYHKTNTVTTSSHNKACNSIFCFWQHSHKSDNIFQGNSYVYWEKNPNIMVWR